MIIGKLTKKTISKIVLGIMIPGAIPTSSMGSDVLAPYCQKPQEFWLEHSLPLEHVERFPGMTSGFPNPNGLYGMERILNALLKKENLPHYPLSQLADPRYKSKKYNPNHCSYLDPCKDLYHLTSNQMDFLGPLIGGHENFIRLWIKPENKTEISGIKYFINIEHLILSNYSNSGTTSHLESIKVLPPEIKNLRKLTFLQLDESCLESLPSDLHELPCLESFTLTKFNFSLDPLWTMTNLKKLVLKGGVIITKGFFVPERQDFKDDYCLLELPGEIGNLVNLEALNLRMNVLSDLPCTFSCLTNLKKLSLECNKFVTLPPVIGTLVSLQNLCVRMNKLEDFPEILLNLTNLEKLNLRSNHKITKIPSKIHKLTALNELLLEQNRGLHKYWAKNWKRHVEKPTLEQLAEGRLQLISHGVENPDAVIEEALSKIDRENAYVSKLQDLLADQKMLYDIATKNILVLLWFKEWNIPVDIGTVLNGFIIDLHVRDTMMFKVLHPIPQINTDIKDDSD